VAEAISTASTVRRGRLWLCIEGSYRVGLGKTLLKLGRVAEARRELQAVVDEKAPSIPADWQLRDLREARALLASAKGES
jgi:hypothetical protein